MILLIVVMFAFMYFGMMRPQKKQQQKRAEMLQQMKKGDKVVTIGGLHGVIDSIDNAKGTVDLDLDGIFLTFNLSAIRTVEPTTTTPAATSDAVQPQDDAKSTDDKPYSEPTSEDEHSDKD
ncbi:preprotein translocase subunit YajC [Lacticaseibacillus baoqingensis]|uniref:Preprotein translocase subunit YajC n=1 Tax=Lacticaseibacillus baoqingensis TaxID=2486013 RepID=A0ABW4EAQ8_9LACO